MSSVLSSLSAWIDQNLLPQQSLVIAYSGGRDSHVLLHALWQLQQQITTPLKLRAIHVNHGLQPDAQGWVQHCQRICEQYQIPFEMIALQLTAIAGESIENIARKARYLAFSQRLQANEIILTAHSMDDQAETFILQLVRGAGVKGLAGIAQWKALGKGHLARPLLHVSRDEIASYAQHYQLPFVEDKTNAELRFRRNFIRHQVMPLLAQINPSIAACIARSATHCQQAQTLLTENILEQDYHHCLDPLTNTLQVTVLQQLSALKQRSVIRHWLQTQQVTPPSVKKLDMLIHQMLTAKPDAKPCISWSGVQVQRFQGRLYLTQDVAHQRVFQNENQLWDLHTPLKLTDGSHWQASLQTGKGISASILSKGTLQIRFRQGGERCCPVGKKGSRPLKKWLHEMAVPRWERPYIPLFYYENQLVSVGELFVCREWQVQEDSEKGWVIRKVKDVC
jgi:tRNA(Ile)-lysidine synthase